MYHVVTMGDVTPAGSRGPVNAYLDALGLGRSEALAAGLALGLVLGVVGVLAFRR